MDERRFRNPSQFFDAISANRGISPREIVSELFALDEHIESLTVNDRGKFRVLGLNKLSEEDWVEDEFDSAREALEFARRKTDEAKPGAAGKSTATVFLAYNPIGEYLGGDTWQPDDNLQLA